MSFIVQAPGVNLINAFLVILLVIFFCKLDHFINVNDICHIELKRSSFVKRVSKFTQKVLYY